MPKINTVDNKKEVAVHAVIPGSTRNLPDNALN
jgi:hypothetical protein